jgi:hypothetical protein
VTSTDRKARRRLAAACGRLALVALPLLLAATACDLADETPSENNTYNVHLYYGKDVDQDKYLGKVQGISKCRTAVHAEAARMQLTGNTYSYACCWVYAGEACHQKHK